MKTINAFQNPAQCFRQFIIAFVCCVLSGCGANLPVVQVVETDVAKVATDIEPTSRTEEKATKLNLADRSNNNVEILVLTSGGADGAFGAGALSSWSKSDSRPLFDIVSGVSSGALQAPFAFLGAKYDPLLKHFFTTTRTNDVLAFNTVRSLIGSGLYSADPLRRKLSILFDDALLNEIAVEHRTGRRLYVTTTDMTIGRSYVWDMGSIAASDRADRQSRFVSILLASTAVPGLIEPVLISKDNNNNIQTHADGGVNMPVPLYEFMFADTARKRSVTVIVNGHNSPVAATRAETSTILPLAKRAISLLLRQLLHISAEQARNLAAKHNASFRIVSLPVSTPEAKDPFDFRPAEMRILFNEGAGINPQKWH